MMSCRVLEVGACDVPPRHDLQIQLDSIPAPVYAAAPQRPPHNADHSQVVHPEHNSRRRSHGREWHRSQRWLAMEITRRNEVLCSRCVVLCLLFLLTMLKNKYDSHHRRDTFIRSQRTECSHHGPQDMGIHPFQVQTFEKPPERGHLW